MNYYEHHIGDHLKKTAHLSMVEEGAYRRLLDVYYTNEKPLPGNLKDCCKLARAQSKSERDAVAYVLGEFFQLESDGYHQTRCDDEIGAYLDKVPEAERKRANDRERQNRSRERRKALFDALRDHGIVAPWNAKTSWLEAELSRVTTTSSHAPVTRDNTATQSPGTSPQTPDPVEIPLPGGACSTPNSASTRPPPAVIKPIGDWSPRAETVEALTGPIYGHIPTRFVIEQAAEFLTYWRDRDLPAASWDAKFIKRCSTEWKTTGHLWTANPGENHATGNRNPRTPAEHKLAAIRATVDYDEATNF